MKKKIGDLTLKEIRQICNSNTLEHHKCCEDCAMSYIFEDCPVLLHKALDEEIEVEDEIHKNK